MKKYTFTHIDAVIVTIALNNAKRVLLSINQGNLFEEEIVLDLVAWGVKAKSEFKPGERSLKSHLNEKLYERGRDLRKKYKRKMAAHIQYFNSAQDLQIALDNAVDTSTETTQQEQDINEMLGTLNDEERAFIGMLEDKNTAAIEREWGWSHGKVIRFRDRLRKKIAKLQKKWTF